MAMTKKEFKVRWESDESGGGICGDDIAECAVAWGLYGTPKTHRLSRVLYSVLKAADTEDAEDFNPENFDECP